MKIDYRKCFICAASTRIILLAHPLNTLKKKSVLIFKIFYEDARNMKQVILLGGETETRKSLLYHVKFHRCPSSNLYIIFKK